MKRKNKIIVLWLMIMIGFVCHSLMDMLPLFWGHDISISDSGTAPQGVLMMMAVITFLLPVCAISCLLTDGHGGKQTFVNAVLAVIMALVNIAHMFMELPSTNYSQYIIMPCLAVIGIYLAYYSVRLSQQKQ